MPRALPAHRGTEQRVPVSATRVADAKWDVLLVCVAAYLLTGIGHFQLVFPVLRPLKPALVAGILSIMLYLAAARGIRDVTRLWNPTTKYVLLILLWVALSVPGAIYQGGSFRLLTDAFIKTVVMYLVTVGAVRGARDVERLVFVYFLGAAVYAAVALSRGALGGSDRLGGFRDYDPNDLATYLLTALPFALYFLVGQRRLVFRAVGGAGLVVLAMAFAHTGSRGGFLALVGVAVFFLLGYRSVRLRWRMLGTAFLGLLLLVGASDSYWQRMETLLHPEQDYNYTAAGGRWQLWQRGIGYMLQRPLFGLGAGNFGTAEGTISPLVAQLQERDIGVKWSTAHNSFVEIGAELGVPGLLFFAGVLITTFGALRAVRQAAPRVAPLGPGPPRLAHALMASLVGFTVGAFFLSFAYEAMLYTVAAFAVGLRKVTVSATLATPPLGGGLRRRHR